MIDDYRRIKTLPWKTFPTKDIILLDTDVHVWCLPLEIPQIIYQSISSFLSPDEISRARRFHFDEDRYFYTIRRALLRVILGNYTGIQPGCVRFSYNEHGKPELQAGSENNFFLDFNVSSSYNVSIFAVSKNRNVGVDLEKIRKINELESIVDNYFPEPERSYFSSQPVEHRQEAFFVLWTRMEAYLKAQGIGFSSQEKGKLDSTTLSPNHEQVNSLQWHFWNFSPEPGFTAGLAFYGHGAKVLCLDWINFNNGLWRQS